MTRFTYQFLAGSLLWGLLCTVPCGAATTTKERSSPLTTSATATNSDNLRDPDALAELKRATDFLAALPRLHLKADVVFDVSQEDGRLLQFEKYGDIYLQRPDQLYVEVFLDDGRHRQIWYDGEMLSYAERSLQQHTRVKAPPTIDATLDMLEERFEDPMPIADLLYSDLTPLAQLALEADIVGNSLVHGRLCNQLAFRGETVDWQLWIEKGEKPFIRKLTISYREIPGMPQFVAWIDIWETPNKFSDKRFTFTAPAGSESNIELVPMPHRVDGGREK